MDLRPNLNNYLYSLDIKLPEERLIHFELYAQWLIEWNERVNLTAITGLKAIYTKHFYDSLTISKVIDLKNKHLLDIGSGAGFPGLALKLYEPSLKLTIIEGNSKKVRFIQTFVDYLKLTNITVIHGRAETLINDYRESFDIVTTRAVAKMNIISELCIPFVKEQGVFIAMKGLNYKPELDESRNAILKTGGEVENISRFAIPYAMEEHHLIIVRKINKTNPLYPRTFAQIKSKPL